MASVSLDTVFLAAVTDLSATLELDVPGIEDDEATDGEVRTYANGRRRAVGRAGTVRTIPLEPDWLTRDDVATLRSWRGQTVLYRDPTGRKVYGVFYRLTASPYVLNDMEKVSLTLTEVTHSEEV